MNALDLTAGQSLAGFFILLVFGVMAIWQSVFPRVRPARSDDRAWIDERIAAETDPARRAAWRMIRNQRWEDQ